MGKKVPSYRLHKSSGQAAVRLDGHDYYLGLHGTPESHAEYARITAEWLAGGRHLSPRKSAVSVDELLLAYLRFALTRHSEQGEPTKQYDRITRSLAPARRLYGPQPAGEFGPRALKTVREQMVGLGWSRKVINQRVYCLIAAFAWGVEEEMIGSPTWHALQAVKPLEMGFTDAPDYEDVPPAPETSISAVLGVISPVLADVIRTQLLTGARPGEAVAFNGAEMDCAGKVWLYKPRQHKTRKKGRERIIYIGPRCQEILAPYLAKCGDGWLFSPAESTALFRERQRATRASKVQPSQLDRSKANPKKKPGERYRVDSYGQSVARACERAGCESFSPHQLRHNACSRIVSQFGWEVARIVLGHRSIDTTRIYGDDDTGKAIAAMLEAG